MFKSQKGLTLIEVILTLAILIVVIAMAFQMNFFGQKVASNGLIQNQAQTEQRLLASWVDNELKKAGDIQILTEPVRYQNGIRYIYSNGGCIYLRENGLERKIYSTDSSMSSEVQFNSLGNGLIEYIITTSKKGHSYSLGANTQTAEIGAIPDGVSGTVISYSNNKYYEYTSVADNEQVVVNSVSLTSPADGSTQSTSVTFSWNAVAGASGYTLTYWEDKNNSSQVNIQLYSGSISSYLVNNLKKNTNYKWTVAYVLNGTNIVSEVHSFNVDK